MKHILYACLHDLFAKCELFLFIICREGHGLLVILTSVKKLVRVLGTQAPSTILRRGTLTTGPQHSGRKTLGPPALASVYKPSPRWQVSVKQAPSTVSRALPSFFWFLQACGCWGPEIPDPAGCAGGPVCLGPIFVDQFNQ